MMEWKDVSKLCNIPIERAIVLSDTLNEHRWRMLTAGRILERLEIHMLDVKLKQFNNWTWLEFNEITDAMAFKLSWKEK